MGCLVEDDVYLIPEFLGQEKSLYFHSLSPIKKTLFMSCL